MNEQLKSFAALANANFKRCFPVSTRFQGLTLTGFGTAPNRTRELDEAGSEKRELHRIVRLAKPDVPSFKTADQFDRLTLQTLQADSTWRTWQIMRVTDVEAADHWKLELRSST